MTRRPAPPANDNTDRAPEGAAKAAPCVICGNPQSPANAPFCSPRCADVDLGRWLNGSYAIPVVNDDDDEDGVSQGGEG